MTALPGRTTAEFTDLDAARSAFGQIYAPASVEAPAGTSLIWHSTLAPLGPFLVGADLIPSGARASMAELADRYAFSFPSAGGMRLHHGGLDLATIPGRAAGAFSLMRPWSIDIAAGTRNRTLIVERRVINEHLHKLTGRAPRRPFFFHPRSIVCRKTIRISFEMKTPHASVWRMILPRPDQRDGFCVAKEIWL